MNERQLIVDWLRGRGDLYPKDVFTDQHPSGPLQVVRADAWSAQVARKFCDVWASQIEAGDHLNSGETLISNKRKEQMKGYCNLCKQYVDNGIVHLRIEHELQEQTWPDGEPVIVNSTLEPADFELRDEN